MRMKNTTLALCLFSDYKNFYCHSGLSPSHDDDDDIVITVVAVVVVVSFIIVVLTVCIYLTWGMSGILSTHFLFFCCLYSFVLFKSNSTLFYCYLIKRRILLSTNTERPLSSCHTTCRFINARRRILQPMLDASNPDPAPKAKKMKSQHRPTQRFWPDSIVAGVLQTHRSQTGNNNSESMSALTRLIQWTHEYVATIHCCSYFFMSVCLCVLFLCMWKPGIRIAAVYVLTTRRHYCHILYLGLNIRFIRKKNKLTGNAIRIRAYICNLVSKHTEVILKLFNQMQLSSQKIQGLFKTLDNQELY